MQLRTKLLQKVVLVPVELFEDTELLAEAHCLKLDPSRGIARPYIWHTNGKMLTDMSRTSNACHFVHTECEPPDR